jgi:hypothetical protein
MSMGTPPDFAPCGSTLRHPDCRSRAFSEMGRIGTERSRERLRRRFASQLAGISVGGIIVIVGIVLMVVWSFWIGLIIVLVGLIAFWGFARGKWY